ncbi:hypothetical protein WAX46_11955 [Bacillus sp. FJAT-53060]|uniref:hypothetical protein n=1 Tax=Bacillus TaxID=1386 RepID=UPI001CFA5F44|nr:hypothetical protein [Bacillus stratosphericus]
MSVHSFLFVLTSYILSAASLFATLKRGTEDGLYKRIAIGQLTEEEKDVLQNKQKK